jgi:hypothetical protein
VPKPPITSDFQCFAQKASSYAYDTWPAYGIVLFCFSLLSPKISKTPQYVRFKKFLKILETPQYVRSKNIHNISIPEVQKIPNIPKTPQKVTFKKFLISHPV